MGVARLDLKGFNIVDAVAGIATFRNFGGQKLV